MTDEHNEYMDDMMERARLEREWEDEQESPNWKFIAERWRELHKDTERKLKTAEHKLEQIENWCRAYPVAVFPEPDWKIAAKALRDAGLTLDSVSASNMRHVLYGIIKIIEND